MAALILAALLICAAPLSVRADSPEAYSDDRWFNGYYDSTLGDMAGRRLYVYGIVDSQGDSGDETRDDQIFLLPDNPVNRLEIALMLYRLCGSDVVAAACPFTDVPEEYQTAVGWLYASGVTHGISRECYGTAEITRVQFLAMLSRLLDWETNLSDQAWDETLFESELVRLAGENQLLPPGLNKEIFTHADAYLILLALMERQYPEMQHPIRPELSRPNQITLYVHSYQDAEDQISSALLYAPARLGVVFEDNCPEEEIEAFLEKYDLEREGFDSEPPFTMVANTSGGLHSNLSRWADRSFRFSFTDYAPAYLAYLDTADWLRCFDDEAYSEKILEFREEMILTLAAEDADDYTKVRKAHDLLIRMASYDMAEYDAITQGGGSLRGDAHSITGFLSNGVIVCDGYAKTFQWMMRCLGVDCFVVYGKGNNDNHAWNKVRVNGVWYNMDVCWDDTGSCYDYFLKSDSSFRQNRHDFLESYVTTCYESALNYW